MYIMTCWLKQKGQNTEFDQSILYFMNPHEHLKLIHEGNPDGNDWEINNKHCILGFTFLKGTHVRCLIARKWGVQIEADAIPFVDASSLSSM